jgi:pyruvate dehydrogenase phosphatase
VGGLAELYSAASTPDHTDVEDTFSFLMKDTPDGGYQREQEPGLIKGLYKGILADPNILDEDLDKAIKKAFTSLDSLIVDELTQTVLDRQVSKEEGIRLLSLANAGSCALLGIYNNVKRTFKVALTGDSRAVLGRRVALKDDDTYAYETFVLSEDQNAYNPHEVERLEAAHPGENICEDGRTLGWGLSRAFGDASCNGAGRSSNAFAKNTLAMDHERTV